MRKKGEKQRHGGSHPVAKIIPPLVSKVKRLSLTRLGSFKDEAVRDDLFKFEQFFKPFEATLLELEAKCSTSAAPRSAAMHSPDRWRRLHCCAAKKASRHGTNRDCRRQHACSNRAAHFAGLNSEWQVCGEAVDGADAVEKAQRLAPDLILMDFSMPQMDGIQAARKIGEFGTHVPILLVTLSLTPQIMELAKKAGMRGAISKSEISKLPYAIKALQRGEMFFA